MDFIKMLIDAFTNGLIKDINKVVKQKKESFQVLKMTSLKTIYLVIFAICFLMGNFTSMMAIVLKDLLGYGILFPISSCIFLYIGCIVSLRCMYISNKEKEFFVKKIEYDKAESEDNL